MMRIAITQRVADLPDRGERRDCLDQRWALLLESLGMQMVPVPNGLRDPLAWAEACQIDGLILSGGNDLLSLPDPVNPAPERDHTETLLLEWAETRRLPVLGVCRGMQMINQYCGGTLRRLEGHVAVRHELICAPGDPIFANFEEVNSYHDRGLMPDDLAPALRSRSRAADDSVEALSHRELPWIGIMWHPEREQPFHKADLQLLEQLFREN